MKNTDYIIVRVDPKLKDKIQKMADKEDRTLSNYVRIILKKWAEEVK